MTKRIGVREITRNFSILDEYDFVEIEDKKTHKIKGMFVSEKFLDDVREFLEAKKTEEIEKKISEIREFVGKVEIEDRFKDMPYKEVKKRIAQEKYGKK